MEDEITIIPKLHCSYIYYIFRENGQEVSVNIKGNYPQSSHKLTSKELNFINYNIL